MLFPIIKKVDININEIVIVELFEGKRIAGVVDQIFDDYFYLRASASPDSYKQRFSFKIDKIIKLN